MRKWVFGTLVLAVVAFALPAAAEGDFEFETEGQVRARLDWFDSFNDVDSGANTNENSTSVWPFRANIGLTGSFNEMFAGYIELQAAGFFGDDNTLLQSYPGPSNGTVDLYQAYVSLDTDRWDFKFGRMEHQLGNELIFGNNSFYNGLVFDGITANADWDSFGLGLYVFKLDENDALFPGSTGASDDMNVFGFDLDFQIGNSDLTPYWVQVRNDNEGLNTSIYDSRVNLSTVGILWKRPTVDESGWDLSVELAGQFGDVGDSTSGELDNGGILFEGWFGWTLGGAGRIHIGGLYASGDDGNDPNAFDAWLPLFEDGHAYNRLGNLDLFNAALVCNSLSCNQGMSNIQDINIGYTWGPSADSKHAFFAAVHQFTRPEAVGDDDLGTELDLTYGFEIVENSHLQVGVAFLSAGDALGVLADDTMRFWVQIESSWGKAKPWTAIGQQAGWMN